MKNNRDVVFLVTNSYRYAERHRHTWTPRG